MIGQTLGHYRIESKLGEGGMGVVYKARDAHLDRPVAIKVLATDKVADPGRKQRFVQEAKAASALNHPNIVTIHDIASDAGVDYIVMEFVPGRTLDHTIQRKGLRLGETLKYAIQIADALTTAHEAGIVHRDLKPANIIVTDKGVVKVLDFGLAKLTERVQDDEAATLTIQREPHNLTEEGTVLGTVSYLSPEQAEGKRVDARSDIFAFGSLLYEMVTGRRAFHGDSKMLTITAILRDDPKPPGELGDSLPRDLEKIIARCLRKDPARRFQHMDDVKVALEELKEESDTGKLISEIRPSRRRRSTYVLPAAGIVLAVVAATAWMLSRRLAPSPPAKSPPTLVLRRITSDSGLTMMPTLSPDGKLLAYSSDRGGGDNLDIWVQQVTGGQPIRLTQDPGDDFQPSFSPDGSKLVYVSSREGYGIYVIPALGGDSRLIAKGGSRPRFSPDGNWIAYSVGGSRLRASRIAIVPAAGGPPRDLQTDVPWVAQPIWSPDGKHLLFVCNTDPSGTGQFDWCLAPPEGGKVVRTGAFKFFENAGLTASRYAGTEWVSDQIIFAATLGSSINLWKVRISAVDGQVKDPPQRLTTGPTEESGVSALMGPDGTLRLAFGSGNDNSDIWSLPINANQGKILGAARKLTEGTAAKVRPRISRNGRKMVFRSNRSGNWDIWVKDLESGKETAVTAGPAEEINPGISPDGSSVFYALKEKTGRTSIYVAPLSGGVPEKLCDDCGLPLDWSPDGTKILYWSGQPIRYSTLDIATREQTEVVHHPKYNVHAARFSPDMRWIAFHVPSVAETGRSTVFISPFRRGGAPPSEWIAIGDGTLIDSHPWWSPDGNLLYFMSQRDGFLCIWTQRLNPQTHQPVGPAQEFYHLHTARRQIIEGDMGPGITPSNLILTLYESTGNIWMAAEK